jgi:hypothetical protein
VTGNFDRMCAHACWLFFNCDESDEIVLRPVSIALLPRCTEKDNKSGTKEEATKFDPEAAGLSKKRASSLRS